ncbi:DUF7575 domain-containing protein [Halobellus clavatus]|jgi:hypothetical protein|uniref:DUF7575 domain-containing protein n=1 Tax=Halobellus clavatus TaxID=660517 RepID=A0A1H3DFC8_9EURY|nr:zinc ribbon domain-containing protein [Halobellus clavatus]SDX64389.1 hypothetical protein SAMN04487946_101504 [Halobellus clavatus]
MSGTQGKRPWLAALLGTLATGLGHFYLRRWGRGLGWFALAVLVSLFFVPADAAQTLLDGGGDPATLLPVFAIGVASVADAYLLARRGRTHAEGSAGPTAESGPRREPQEGQSSGAERSAGRDESSASTDPVESAGSTDGGTCPSCGKELDPDLDFCPWCTARLE